MPSGKFAVLRLQRSGNYMLSLCQFLSRLLDVLSIQSPLPPTLDRLQSPHRIVTTAGTTLWECWPGTSISGHAPAAEQPPINGPCAWAKQRQGNAQRDQQDMHPHVARL